MLVLGLGATSWASTPEASKEAAPSEEAEAASSADAEYQAGKEALSTQNYDKALKRFKQGLKLAQDDERTSWQMMLAVAVTYQRMGRPAFAIEYYKRFLKRSDDYRDALTVKWSNRRSMAERDIEALETTTKTTHGFVTVVSDPPGADIFLGQDQAGADKDAKTTFGMYVRAGHYNVTLKLQGYQEVTRKVEVAEGKLVALKVTLSPVTLDPPTEGLTKPDDSGPKAGDLSAELTLGSEPNLGPWIVFGTGGAVGVASIVLAVVAMGARSDWEDYAENYQSAGDGDAIQANSDTYDALGQTTKGYELAMGVTAGVAVATMVGGLVWWLIDTPSQRSADTAGLPELYLAPSPGGLTGHATWRF